MSNASSEVEPAPNESNSPEQVNLLDFGHHLGQAEDGSLQYKFDGLKYSLRDKLRAIQYEIDAINSEIRYVLRKAVREANNLFRAFDVAVLFTLLIIAGVTLFTFSTYIIPFVISMAPESVIDDPQDTIWGPKVCKDVDTNGDIVYSSQACESPTAVPVSGWPFARGYTAAGQPKFTGLSTYIFGLWTSDTTIRIMAGGAGALGVALRLLFKSDIDKFQDKVKGRQDITYVFGTTVYAERLLYRLVFEFAYEDEAALVADTKFLWVERIAGLLDTYLVPNPKEFEKNNMYNIIGFKNAKRIYILTDDTERNQNILTNIRAVRPDVPIYILSQYTPDYLKSGGLVEDENLHIIDDLETTREGLVKSLSMDIKFPPCTEINVPRPYIGAHALQMTRERPKLEILAIRRPNIDDSGWQILPPNDVILQRTDRILVHYTWDFGMKQANRMVTELPVRHLVDLGDLRVETKPSKCKVADITDLPGRMLLLEPKGVRKSWIRRIIAVFSLVCVILGMIIGRNPSLDTDPVIAWDFAFFFSGVIGFLLVYLLRPLPNRGMMYWSKTEKKFHKHTKVLSLLGSDMAFDFSKMERVMVVLEERKNKKGQVMTTRSYAFENAEGERFHTVKVIIPEEKAKDPDILVPIRRFEDRLQNYTGLVLKETFQVESLEPSRSEEVESEVEKDPEPTEVTPEPSPDHEKESEEGEEESMVPIKPSEGSEEN